MGEDNSLWFLEDKTTKHGVSIDRPRRLEFKNAKDWPSTDYHEWPIRDKKIEKILTGIQEMALFLAFTEDKEWYILDVYKFICYKMDYHNPDLKIYQNTKSRYVNYDHLNLEEQVDKIVKDPRSGFIPPLDVLETLLRSLAVKGFQL